MATLLEIRTQIQNDLDLFDQFFMPSAQIDNHINKAIRDAGAIILNLYEDYFLDTEALTLVSGTSLYSLPSDIFANKIRRIIYDDGSRAYKIKRIENINMIPSFQDADDYWYMMINDLSAGMKLKLYPASRVSSATLATYYYIRKPKVLSSDSDIMDIPEFENYILARAKQYVLDKDPGNPIIPVILQEVQDQKTLMEQTLSYRQPDDQGLIQIDGGFSIDNNCYDYGGDY